MGWVRPGAHRKTPLLMLVMGLLLIGGRAYQLSGRSDLAQAAAWDALAKLSIQVPAGIIACWVASRLIDFDFGTIGIIALRIAGITVLAEGVAGWVPEPFSPFFAVIAELAVMLVGFFWLFELGRWETYLLVILNLAVLFGAYYVLGTMLDSPRSPMARPGAHARRSHR